MQLYFYSDMTNDFRTKGSFSEWLSIINNYRYKSRKVSREKPADVLLFPAVRCGDESMRR
ncbi:MAG: hypothetical protein COX19_15810 [Desulfobacterales bacterium CG23_combo_of_CG06-09_8_20_14_all_51_8]|nr:MAG: hypothetical protein COX19_15810 [Desulfobacterales bacterium CG23_combo_of_CG06-09_8_20_14_all_51_8]